MKDNLLILFLIGLGIGFYLMIDDETMKNLAFMIYPK